MRLLIFFGVYEAEKSFAHATLRQLCEIFCERGDEVHIAIQDDASPSHVGEELLRAFAPRLGERIRLIRLDRSLGYHGTFERVLGFMQRALGFGPQFDYLLRVDADAHFCRARICDLFAHESLPDAGLVGPTIQMRHRDLLLFLADLVPAGMRRRKEGDRMHHAWELARARPVWWHDIGRQSLMSGFRGRIVPGVFQIIAWKSVQEMASRGWLTRPRSETGLIFQDDVLVTAFVKALGHPVVDINQLVPDWKCDLFMDDRACADDIRVRGLDLIHPMKDRPWAHALREALPLR